MNAQEFSDPDAWRGHCLQLMDNLLQSDDSSPFKTQVDLDLYPVGECSVYLIFSSNKLRSVFN